MVEQYGTGEDAGQSTNVTPNPLSNTAATSPANAPAAAAPVPEAGSSSDTTSGATGAAAPTPPAQEAAAELPPEPVGFDEMQLRPDVRQAIEEMGWVEPTLVQRATFWKILAGRDLLAQAHTGSGKTGAFAVPFAQRIIDVTRGEVQALALCPTRELALQVATECNRIGGRAGLKVAAVYGGAPMGKQIDALREGAQVVAGTPGRVLDHLRRGTLQLKQLRVLVLDECDEMLSMGFYEEISEIIKRCPTDRQTLLFSATIPEDIERIAQKYMRHPEMLSLSGGRIDVHQISHSYYMVSGMGRSRDLVSVLNIEKPEAAIIFCNTREETSQVAEYLRRAGFDAEAISSDLTQADRERVMGRMRARNLRYLVATDIAARGIDISDLSHVINYTFPESPEIYVHRTGRTGRAGKSGAAVSLISPRELGNFYYLKLTYKIRPEERQLPTPEEEETRLDGERMEKLVSALGARTAGDEWRRLARRVWSGDGGEAVVAALIQDWFARETEKAAAQAQSPSATPPRVEPAGAAADEGAARTYTDRRGRERRRRSRDERPSRGDEARRGTRPARAERHGEGPATARAEADGAGESKIQPPPAEDAPTPANGPTGPTGTSTAIGAPQGGLGELEPQRVAEGETAVQAENGTSAGLTSGATPDAAGSTAESPAERRATGDGTTAEAPARGRRRRSRERTERTAGRAPARTRETGRAAKSGAPPVIETTDDREFWEVWADENVAQAAPAPAASTTAPAARSDETPGAEREELETGTARLYLGLGRRDGLRPEEIERWLAERGIAFRRILVRNTHTFLTVDESAADATVAALHGSRHGDRALTCERARR